MARHEDRPDSRISLSTLVIASVASVAATFLVSRAWGPGTILGAAATPVIVALVSEALRRPAERLPPIPGVRPPRREQARPPAGRAPQGGPATGAPQDERGRPDGPDAFSAPRKDFRSGSRNRWRLAIATGLAAFVLVVAAFTLVDLVAGKPVTGSGNSTFFDPSRRHESNAAQPTAPATTATTAITVTAPTGTTTAPTVTATAPTTGATQPTTPPPAVGTTPPPPTESAPTTP